MILNIIISVLIVIGFLFGIRLMQSPRTAIWGNRLGALCMVLAIIFVFVELGLAGDYMVWLFLVLGSIAGIVLGQKVNMIQMPQTVALFNGLGGAASALVAAGAMIFSAHTTPGLIFWLTAAIALSIGALTFSGSIVAALKLQGWIFQKPLSLKALKPILYLLLAAGLILAFLLIYTRQAGYLYLSLSAFLLYGVFMALRIGGADMPVTISFLNSLSGIAASVSGLAVGNMLLAGVGSLVGVAGMILTRIMCRSMNRSLFAVLSGFKQALKAEPEQAAQIKGKNLTQEDIQALLGKAKKVIIVPGYGMALAQAQKQVKELLDLLQKQKKIVKIAIHPVAGRMPGHMNVLLAEAGIDYGNLFEMDIVNEEFSQTDAVIVVGACDVINPAANTAQGTPIYGMPILKAYEAKSIIILNLDEKPGYSGVENTLYGQENVITVWGDASKTLPEIIKGYQKFVDGE